MILEVIGFRFKLLLLLLIYFTPLAALIWFVASFSVNVPFHDQWALVKLFDNINREKAGFIDLFAQHNEHRIFFPKLIFATLAFFSKWDIRYELYCSIFFATITFLGIYKISTINSKYDRSFSLHLTNIMSCILVFSLAQIENLLWGFQLAWFLVNTCLVLAVLIITLSIKSSQKFYFAAVPCLVASFSSAHGLLVWLAVIPSIAAVNGSLRQRIIRMVVWIFLFIATFSIYTIGYHKPGHHPSLFFLLKSPFIALNYLLTLLGASLTTNSRFALVLGVIIFSTFLFLIVNFIRTRPKFRLDPEVTAWISIGLFALLFAFVTTIGRAGFGIEQAMSSRYTTSSILLIIAILHLWRLSTWKNDFIAGVIAGLILINSVNVVPQAELVQLQRQAGKTCLEVIEFIATSEPSNNCLNYLYPFEYTDRVRERTKILESLGFIQESPNIGFNSTPVKVPGYFGLSPNGEAPLTVSHSSSLRAEGWAILPDSQQMAKTVLLSYGSNPLFFAHALVNLDSPDVAKYLNSSRYSKVRWAANISLKSLPLGETVIKAWVYNPASKQFIKLNGEPKIKVVE